MRGAILAVAAQKGGVGKTTLSYELAAVLDAVLIDLDFHSGGATAMWGFKPEDARRVPLLDALERDDQRPPRPKHRTNRPDLVPSHPDLSAIALDATEIADYLEAWAVAWERPVVIDTHPGAHATTDGAVQVADLLIVPVPIGQREMAATRSMLRDHQGFPILLVPMMVPGSPPKRYIEDLRELSAPGNIHLAPIVSEHRWLKRRLLTTALTRQGRGERTQRAAAEYQAVAEKAADICRQAVTA
jgi:chromosome partitioning protein